MPADLPEDPDQHYETVLGCGAAYYAFRGWVLTCVACGHETRDANKDGALISMQQHYDVRTGGYIEVKKR